MTAPRYLLVKHIPDLARGEPRNVGVILWTPWLTDARFCAEKLDAPGTVDGRSIPDFIRSKSAYRQWVRFWRREISSASIVPIGGGDAIARSSPAFADALKRASRGDFIVEDGGYVLDVRSEDDVSRATDELYESLVEPPTTTQDEGKDPRLEDLCDEAIELSGIDRDPRWTRDFALACAVAPNVREDFSFTYAFGESDAPKRIYQRVPLAPRRKAIATKTVHHCAWMFEKVVSDQRLPLERCVALVNVPEERAAEPDVDRHLKVLRSVARVVNVAEPAAAAAEFADALSEAAE
jgi:hypothetical protein